VRFVVIQSTAASAKGIAELMSQILAGRCSVGKQPWFVVVQPTMSQVTNETATSVSPSNTSAIATILQGDITTGRE
jgi:hypothetical protein